MAFIDVIYWHLKICQKNKSLLYTELILIEFAGQVLLDRVDPMGPVLHSRQEGGRKRDDPPGVHGSFQEQGEAGDHHAQPRSLHALFFLHAQG